MRRLADAGLVDGTALALRGATTFMDAAAALAGFDQAATVEAARVREDGTPMATVLGAVREGANAVLIWESGPDGSVRFVGVSPAGLLSIAADFLGNPEALPMPDSATGQRAAAGEADRRICPHCGAPVKAADRFCRGCGGASA